MLGYFAAEQRSTHDARILDQDIEVDIAVNPPDLVITAASVASAIVTLIGFARSPQLCGRSLTRPLACQGTRMVVDVIRDILILE